MPIRLTLAAAFLLATGCGSSDTPEEPGLFDQARQMGQAAQGMQEMAERLEASQDVPPAEPVDFRQLRELFPESVLGASRSSAEGSRQGMGGFNVSTATAAYEGEPGAEMTLTDMGGVQAAILMGAAWTMTTIDKETDTGFERTVEIDGDPAYETYDSEQRRGEIQALIADRFLVRVSASGVSPDELREAYGAVDIEALRAMRDEGRPTS